MARKAYSLDTLLEQVNARYPNRSKVSDGWIGDAAHAAVASDHNPNSEGVVCALDITNDPAVFDVHALADRLLAVRHPDLKYLISNGRIAGAWTNWQWQKYSGTSDPHINHIHVSVGQGDDGASTQPYDDKINWNVEEEDMSRIIELEELANFRQSMLDQIGATVSVKAPVDGNSLPQILANIRAEQARIDELTALVSNGDSTATKQIAKIKEILK